MGTGSTGDDDSREEAQRRSGVDLSGAVHANALDAVHGRDEPDTAPTFERDADDEERRRDPEAGYGALPAD